MAHAMSPKGKGHTVARRIALSVFVAITWQCTENERQLLNNNSETKPPENMWFRPSEKYKRHFPMNAFWNVYLKYSFVEQMIKFVKWCFNGSHVHNTGARQFVVASIMTVMTPPPCAIKYSKQYSLFSHNILFF